MDELKDKICQLAEINNWKIRQEKSNFILGYREELTVRKKAAVLTLLTIQIATISPINKQVRLSFDCSLNVMDEFSIEKSGFFKRMFSSRGKLGVFLIELKHPTDFYAHLLPSLNKKDWRNLNGAVLTAKNGHFSLVAKSYEGKNLVFLIELIHGLINSNYIENE